MQIIKSNLEKYFWGFGDNPGTEKIIFGSRADLYHYTIVFKGNKRVVDIHKTIELGNGEKQYIQLFEMRYFTLLRFLSIFNKINIYLIKKYFLRKRINIGKLNRHRLILFPIELENGYEKYFLEMKRPKIFKFNKEIEIEPFLKLCKYPFQILEMKDNGYWVYSFKRGWLKRQGIIFKHPFDIREKSFFFISNRNLSRYMKDNSIALFNILKQVQFEHKEEILQDFYRLLEKVYPRSKVV